MTRLQAHRLQPWVVDEVSIMDIVDCSAFKRLLEVESGRGKFIAVFTTSWCGYCRRLIRELEQANPDFRLILVDISDEGCWDDFGVELVPTAVLYKDGKEIKRVSSPDGLRLRDLKALLLSARDE
ncbi:MAG: thioredoxin family protein [Candidatus Methanomethyliales bacterium]|nr:thioredoxin family protein [Candidatus Methanomethylicales archaeon]